jgi:hypothetical protein
MVELTVICEICGEEIALVSSGNLALPMRGSMFKTIDAWHGVPDPFPPDVGWEDMLCPFGRQHRPFVKDDEVTLKNLAKLKLEYPAPPKPGKTFLEVFSDEGLIGDEKEKHWQVPYTCDICGKVINGKGPFMSHTKRMHPDV